MKKRFFAILLAALMVAALLPTAAFAANDKFVSTFFPNGKITRPAAPYIYYEDDVFSEANGDELTGFFELPADIRKLNETLAKCTDAADFDKTYGTEFCYNLRLQLDSKLDDGPWQYTGAWDTASYTGAMEVNVNEFALGYLMDINVDMTDKMIQWFRFSDLSALDPNDFESNAGWAAAAIYPDGGVYRFDFTNHTFSYRYRYLIEYTPAGESEQRYLLSSWSDTVSIGKNGTLKPLTAPTAMPAPVLSGFEASLDEEGNAYAAYYMDIPQTYYDGNAYYEVLDNMWDYAYRIHCEMKVNGGDWAEIEVGNNTWLRNGYRSLFYDELNVTPDDAVQIRVRMENLYTGAFSPYSNVIGTKVFDASGWALPYVEQADALGLIPDCLVGQDLSKQITRQEFAAVAVKIYESLSGTKSIPVAVNPFTDCSDSEVLKGYNIGITNGTAANKFSPNEILNREQLATMLTRIYKKVALQGWTLATDGNYNEQFKTMFAMPAAFADDSVISAWAKDSVYFMKSQGIIDGVGSNLFAPKHGTTAGEAAGYGLATREQALKIAVGMVTNLK